MITRVITLLVCCCTAWAGPGTFTDLLPEVKQAAPDGKPKVFHGEALWDYINGGAEAYHDYGFVKVVGQKYKWTGHKGDFTVDIYDMGKLAHAFGLFSSFRLADSEDLAIGTQAQFNGAALDFYHGQYYIQIGGPASAPQLKEKLVALGKGVAKKINTPVKRPVELGLLLEQDRVRGTEKYVRHNLLGYEFLKEAWGAEYKTGNGKAVLRVLLYPDSKDAAGAYDKYLKENKAAKTASIKDAEKSFTNQDKYAGQVGAALIGDKVVIVTNAPDKKTVETLLKYQLKTLKDK